MNVIIDLKDNRIKISNDEELVVKTSIYIDDDFTWVIEKSIIPKKGEKDFYLWHRPSESFLKDGRKIRVIIEKIENRIFLNEEDPYGEENWDS